ncbi:hypothetical protein [Microbacterium sp. P05]|uniref:hypothetical protein n=1 Tax=Microbacterium sp. P05 TaxID=3366948 RepID=UPI0037469FEE
MDASTQHELNMLQARAYGPEADIDQDPRAAQRLRELESTFAGPEPAGIAPVVPEPAPAEPAPPLGGHLGSHREAIREPEDERHEPEPDSVEARTSFIGKIVSPRLRVWWVLSVIASIVASAAITHALTSIAPVSSSSGAPQIATLEKTTAVEVPSGWFGAGPSSAVFEFFGLTIFESSGGYAVAGRECISAVATEDLPEPDANLNNQSIQGSYFAGCRVGAFPASVELFVDSSAPEEMRAQFPPGSALQFVFDGNRVGVFLDEG